MWSPMTRKKPASARQTQKPHGRKLISHIIIQIIDGVPKVKLGLNKTLYLKVAGIILHQDRPGQPMRVYYFPPLL